MRQYILKRLLLMIPTLFGVAVIVFFLLRVVPGDIVELKYAVLILCAEGARPRTRHQGQTSLYGNSPSPDRRYPAWTSAHP
jgi:ABC-type microcin C transport system permease subunit YejB